MKYDTIDVKNQFDFATVSLNRPDVHNAFNEKLIKELTNCFKELIKDKTIKCIILTGNGESFCAGADLKWMKSMANYSMDENIKDSKNLQNLYETIYSCPKPVICKVNGNAFGGGLGLIAVCDIAIAKEDCKFAFSEVKLGIIPAVISPYVLRRIGLSNMKRLFITGERFDSNYAKEIGLVDFVSEDHELNEIVIKHVELLRSSGPESIKEIKRLADTYEKFDLENYKEFTIKKIAELRVSKEGQEGIGAYLEKRKPKWSE